MLLASRHFATVLLLLASIDVSGQTRHNVAARATANLDAIARQPRSRAVEATGPPREIEEPERALRRRRGAARRSPASRIASIVPTAPATVTPSFNGFQGLADNFTAIPPDTGGAVGPQHIVTMLNTQMTIQTRAGAVRQGYPITLDSFWSPLSDAGQPFDPRILYDPGADRWIAAASANAQLPTSALLVAVSATGDPGGDWHYFKVNTGGSNQWGDFPVLGFNGNWVVVSMNLFQIRGRGNYLGTNLYVFSKADLYDPNGTGNFTRFTDSQGELTPVRDYDNRDPNTLYLVQAIAAEFSNVVNTGTIRLSRIQGSVGSERFFGGAANIVVSDPWADTPLEDGDFGPQLGSTVKVDTGDGRIVNCVMRTGTIWCSHTVFLPFDNPTRAAAQWFQMDPAATPPALKQLGRIQDATNTFFYAYPSIAVNKNNDTLVAYTRFSANDYPSAAFSFRTATDPLNTMQPEMLAKAGEAPYTSPGARSGSNRWGDYSAAMVDPSNDLNFWTVQEYASTPPRARSGAFGTWWAQIVAPSGPQNCTYSLSLTRSTIDIAGGGGTVAVNTTAGCAWFAASSVPWITITSGTTGLGSGTVSYVAARTTDSRTGTISIAGLTFTLVQGTERSAPIFTEVLNGASFAAGPVAPGELITIRGTNLGPPTLQTAPSTAGQLELIAGGTRVLFDGVAAPMLYASGGQISAIAPFGLQGRANTQVQVEFQGTQSLPVTIPVAAAAPAIFAANSSGKGQGAVLNQDFSLNSANLPAARGSVVMIYATGAGLLTSPAIDGRIAALPPLQISQSVSVRIGGVTAPIAYAGAAPGLVNGVVQINAIVPDNVVPGTTVPIDLTIGGVSSLAGITIAVK